MVCDQLKKDVLAVVGYTYFMVFSTMSVFYLFKDTPARREDYVKVTDSSVFPLKFCSVRWVEKWTVAARAIEMWPHVLKNVKSILEKKFPNTKSAIIEAADDPLTPVKLLVFQSFVKQVESFLIAYHSDESDMLKMLRGLRERLIKNDVIKKANSCGKHIRIKVAKKKIICL
ncbi:hypothetical protein PR048_010951 [Dryococelus australis]|uniref:Uncharacterized protein n=1 Tax=Dryococelus australis TaxID=614101 RepID=A0ABQ9HKQ0_9NEOP|nr:hypothetical protein PR048_010951 [Dryococelus australis]